MSVTGQQVANEAKKLKPGIFGLGTIPYVLGGEDPKTGLDCKGLVEYCHRQCGIQMSYKGTNDMWRHMLSEKGTIAEGVSRHGSIPIGALIFICDYNTVPKGYSNTPDCEHVYIKTAKGELVHASASNGKVTTRISLTKPSSTAARHIMDWLPVWLMVWITHPIMWKTVPIPP